MLFCICVLFTIVGLIQGEANSELLFETTEFCHTYSVIIKVVNKGSYAVRQHRSIYLSQGTGLDVAK